MSRAAAALMQHPSAQFVVLAMCCCIGHSASGAEVSAVTPVQKVVELLTRLRASVEEQGKREAVAYDKFCCFCKEQADNKVYAIGRSNDKMGELQAAIDALDGEISQLDADAATARGTVNTEQDAAGAATTKRTGEHAAHLTVRQNLTEGIAAIEGAIAQLQKSKSGVSSASALVATRRELAKLGFGQLSYSPVGDAPAYEYRSSNILGTLQSLLATFKAELAKVDEDEATTRHGHDMVEGARANRIKFLQAEITQKEALSAKKTEERNEKAQLFQEEETARDADQAFLDELTANCQDKAKTWDQRSSTRADEVKAITEALEKLQEASGLYAANKKLVGLLAARRGSRRVVLRHPAAGFQSTPPSFLQLPRHHGYARHGGGRRGAHTSGRGRSQRLRRSGGRGRRMALAAEALRRHLRLRAEELHSGALAEVATSLGAAARVRDFNSSNTDPFVRVRALIKDLVQRLELEATEEATAKGVCDTQMKAAVSKRDAEQQEIESLEASIEATNSTIVGLVADLVRLDEEIAAAHKALNELTQLRTDEQTENQLTIKDAGEGAQAVREAITILRGFYGAASLLQLSPADRHGDTYGDLAPEPFGGNYTGRLAESKGIFGLLEVIASDFERTSQTTTQAESDAQTAFDQQKGTLEQEITDKGTTKTTKEGEKTTKEAELTGFQDDLLDASKLHDEVIKELEALKASCVDNSETWEARKARRAKEIEGLKEALAILDKWQG